MKKVTAITCLFVSGFFIQAGAQVKIGENPNNISPGSVLELESTSKALTLPRMTTLQMQAIPSPINGMIIFNTDSNCIYLYKANNAWASISTQQPQYSPWPYNSDPASTGSNILGDAKGIISLTGTGLVASGNYSHAEGLNSVASGIYSWSIGNADTSTGNASIAMGTLNKSNGYSSIALGYKNVAASQGSISLGQENYDSGWASLAAGHVNSISDQVSYSSALGYQNRLQAGWSNTALGENNLIKGGRANLATGIANIANGNYNNLLGNNNESIAGNSNLLSGEKNKITSGNSNFVSGFNNNANGNYNYLSGNANSTAAGNNNLLSGEGNIVNSGNSNALFGLSNIAEGNFTSAFGKLNVVYFQSAVAMGQGNKDSGWASIAGGITNIIRQNVFYSTSFGIDNISEKNSNLVLTVPGAATFSAGSANNNSGYGSIALGGSTNSNNIFSLAANHGTVSNGYAMSAFGHYNDTIASYPGQNYSPNEILFSIGNGNSSTYRRNSLTMLRNGFTTINASANIGPNIPRAELDIRGTGAMIVPVGTTAQRPAEPVEGMIRLCTDCGPGGTSILQGYDGTNWVNL